MVNILINSYYLNSGDELETDLKINSVFFKKAYGAFVVTSIDDYLSFQEYVRIIIYFIKNFNLILKWHQMERKSRYNVLSSK